MIGESPSDFRVRVESPSDMGISPSDLIISLTDFIISPSDSIVLPFDNYQNLRKITI